VISAKADDSSVSEGRGVRLVEALVMVREKEKRAE
jgi:hypothetical protein